jgi:hypothetical protein
MLRRALRRAALVPAAAVAALALAAALPAQSLAARVGAVQNGSVRMTFTSRPGLCGHGGSIYNCDRSRGQWTDNRRTPDVEWDDAGVRGPVRVVLDVRDREVTAVRAYVGGRWRPAGGDVTDLGDVPAAQAADYLLSLAARAPGKAARDAIFPATLADSAVTWPALLRIARDEQRPMEARRQAIFWVGQAAEQTVTAQLDTLAGDARAEREVREQAVFALSQRPKDEGVPVLIRVARTNRDPAIRKRALFWLGQSRDPRALALFEELLTR